MRSLCASVATSPFLPRCGEVARLGLDTGARSWFNGNMTKTCYFCKSEESKSINAAHWTGTEYVRVDVCADEACRDQIASAPRRPRRQRQPVIVDGGGWANIPGLSGSYRN